jgi:hypothetical protein
MEDVVKVRGQVYLATYEHKHGIDYSIHTTADGAKKWFLSIVSDFIEDFVVDEDDYWHGKSPEEMLEHWDDVTGNLEYFNIIELELNE